MFSNHIVHLVAVFSQSSLGCDDCFLVFHVLGSFSFSFSLSFGEGWLGVCSSPSVVVCST